MTQLLKTPISLNLLLLSLSFAATTTFAAPPTPASIEAILSTNGSQQSLESTLAGVECCRRSKTDPLIEAVPI